MKTIKPLGLLQKQLVIFNQNIEHCNLDWCNATSKVDIWPETAQEAFNDMPHIEKLYELACVCFSTSYGSITVITGYDQKLIDSRKIPDSSIVCQIDSTNVEMIDHLYSVIEQMINWQSNYEELIEACAEVVQSLNVVSDFDIKESVLKKIERSSYWNCESYDECIEIFEELFVKYFVVP